MRPITIKPNRCVVTIESKSKLFWRKEWICKVFNIEPERNIFYSVKVYYSENVRFAKGDIFIAPQDNTKWIVMEYTGGMIEIKNLTNIRYEIKSIDRLVLAGSAMLDDY